MQTKKQRHHRALVLTTLLFLQCTLFVANIMAQKTVYIPNEWRNPWNPDTLLYKESDPDNKYTWSKSRSVESDNVIIFWDKGWGGTKPHELPKSNFYYVDIPYLLQQCESFYDLEINQLGFVDPVTSNLSRYKVMVLMNHTNEWTCYGGGYDFQVSALWLNPSTCKPVGFAVAHEVGHSFHYMCYAEHSGHKDSNTDNTGFHLACGNGQAIWEQTAQWQACQSFPELMFNESYPIFRHAHNYAFSHEWQRYQSYWFHYFINQYYDDITTVAQVWNTPMTGQTQGRASDFNQALMKLKGLSVHDLYKLYFDYACRCVTWDLEACMPYRAPYIGNFEYRCVLKDDDSYQVALASCPQGTGFNVIPLQVPASGTQVTTHLTGLAVGSTLLDEDPGEFFNGNSVYEKLPADANGLRHYVNGGTRSARGFRMGYVALMQDGTRQYFSEDSVYCQGTKNGVTEDYSFVVPEGVSQLWLVVSPALKSYQTHSWDDKIDKDDMWPYSFSLEGTDIGMGATVYAAPTLDGRDISDITFTYDVCFPRDNQFYSGCTVSLTGRGAAALGTAFQMDPSSISSKMQAWNERGPQNGKIVLYAAEPDGTLSQSGSTANGYGHWFNAQGMVTSYANGYIFSEFDPSALSFTIGQYPSRSAEGAQYTIRQTLRYRKNASSYANANFIFHVTVGGSITSSNLQSIDYADPTGVNETATFGTESIPRQIYNLQGQQLNAPQRGVNIINGHKVVVK
ncbi:MAG: DUF4859 domain-containing protein [Prevotella sp.]|nr:DUF4859 domain-containing protein [Prevotella sp.]